MPRRALAQASGFAYLRERAISVIAVKKITPNCGDQDICEPVVVVIGGVGARSPISVGEPGLLRHIFKTPVAEVMEQVHAARSGHGLLPRYDLPQLVHSPAIHNQQVHETIVVIVEPRRSAAVRFGYPALLRPSAPHGSVNAGFSRHIGEAQSPASSCVKRRAQNNCRSPDRQTCLMQTLIMEHRR